MVISKELYKKAQRPDGSCPVTICVYHNGKTRRINTSIYIMESSWNPYDGTIKAIASDYKLKNEIIESSYRRISGKIQMMIDTLLDEKLDDLLADSGYHDASRFLNISENNPDNVSKEKEGEVCFLDLIDKKAASSVSHNTRRGYEGFRRYIEKRFGCGPMANHINQDFTNQFVAAIDLDYKDSESMRRYMISRYNAIVNFGRDTGLIPKRLKIALPPYCLLPANRNLSGEEICNVFSAFVEAMSFDPDIKKKETEALGIFVLDIAFQGLAPVDLANLKVKSLNFTVIHATDKNPRRYLEDEEYRKMYDAPQNQIRAVTLSTTRKKTGRPVQIVASTVGIERFIRKLTVGKNMEDYLLSCFDPTFDYSPSQRQNRLANYFNMMARNLNKALGKYYQRHNLGECRRVTFYFARHAFCNLVDSMDVPRHIIQNMVGHRSSVLETSYLRPISLWEQAKISHTLLSRYFI